ncbi:cell division protein FtsQ/DivIB [Butyrivibrio sp. YAB3001]|uniref:cell division protein FtsQ/DivIB n=1 Tax=Butyrivibrio sp. YAB3001 TaxID=1520812 RepID=UPI0008F67C8D|nr:FtsQ-type POTRA domain-containing protein [Butyrivibrio sp. YAB3001]SFC81260.1 cell division protein FtsQ [Butyrivibrio sp. YAB3001]
MVKKRKRKVLRRRTRDYYYDDYTPSLGERLADFHPLESLKNLLKYSRSICIIFAIILMLFAVAFIVFNYVSTKYTITNIYVNGNTHYTNEEIIDMVMTDKLSHNSIFLSLKYRDKSIEDIPFVQKMDVDIISPDTVRINVYEKAVAGYIAYLGHYMYFDRDGIVVESSMETSDSVPQVMGLDFHYCILYEKLPVENEKVFSEILDITQLLDKYQLNANKIFFDSEYNVYLYFDDVEVSLGTNDYIDEKIIQLQYILPNLADKKGILEMKDFSEDKKNVTFEEKKQ